MNRCDWLLAASYVMAACIVIFSVNVRCKATMNDIERFCMKRGLLMWYAYRAAGVVVIAGGVMHGRLAVGELLKAVARRF
jgi:hypothetical protein